MTHRPPRGTRPQVLACLALIWALTAFRLIVDPPVRNPDIPHTSLPIWVRVLFWAIPSAVAAVAVVWRRLDATAWGLLILPAAERTLSFAVSALGLFGYGPLSSSWGGVLLYATVGFLINRCAKGLDRPPTLPAPALAEPTGTP